MNNSAREAAQSLIFAIESAGVLDWEGTGEIKARCQQTIDTLGGRGYLVHNMTPGAAAVYLCALMIVNT